MSILVTGGAGFIGSHFIERLLSGALPSAAAEPIICLDDYNDYYDPAIKRANVAAFEHSPRVVMVEQSFCDAPAMTDLFQRHQVKYVVHLGAYAGVRTSVDRPLVYEHNNVTGTLVLLETARRAGGVQRFVLVSSSTVYGGDAPAPFQEDGPLGVPISPYGATKRAAELLGLTYHALHHLPVVIVRPFSVYGPRVRPDLAIAIFAQAIEEGRSLPLYGDGTIRRDFTHVRDICDGLLAALERDGAIGQAFNLGHSEPHEVRHVIALLEQLLERKAVVEYFPERPGDMPITYADLSKARRLLGYQPKVPLEEGLREYVDWMHAQPR